MNNLMSEWINDSSIIVSIISGILALVLSIFSTYISRKINRSHEKFSKETIEILNNVAEEVNQETDSIVNKIEEKLKSGSYEKKEDVLEQLKYGIYKKTDNIRFDSKIEELIQNHHEQAIMQSVVQFWFSLIASLIGFVFIIIIISISNDLQWYEYIIKTIPGVVIEAVSVLFFSQAKESRERASDFLNRLREDRQFTKSIAIIDTIIDENLKSLVKAEVALHLCGIKDNNIISKELHR